MKVLFDVYEHKGCVRILVLPLSAVVDAEASTYNIAHDEVPAAGHGSEALHDTPIPPLGVGMKFPHSLCVAVTLSLIHI